MDVDVEGARIHCWAHGEGPGCLVLCNAGTRVQALQMGELGRHFRMVFADLRGSGHSTGAATDLDFDLLSRDLAAVCDAVAFERCVVLGTSILGIPAIEAAARLPDRVSHVTIVGAPPRGDMRWLAHESTRYFERDAEDERKRLLRENRARLAPEHSALDALLAETPMRFFDPRFDAEPLVTAMHGRPDLTRHLLGSLARGWDARERVTALKTPLLVAHGRYDYVVPWRLWEDVLTASSGAVLQMFERSGHQPFFEEPEPFVAALQRFTGARR